MREIKFRAWDDYNKVMKLFTLKQLVDEDIFNYITEFEAVQSGFDNWKWMQFTGLKDKNGKEISEGDIIKSDYGFTYKVIWSTGSFKLRGTGRTKSTSTWSINHVDSLSIIGNIYENPELLNSQE